MLQDIFAKKHIVWVRLMYASIIAKNSESVRMFESFESTEFKHLKWLAGTIMEEYRDFDYENATEDTVLAKTFDFDREIPAIEHDFNELIKTITDELKILSESYEKDFKYRERFASDESYFIHRIEKMQNGIGFESFDSFGATAEDIAKRYNIQNDDAAYVKETLGKLLDKEYKNVLSFFYIITHLENKKYTDPLSDLMYESISHMKYYAILMSSLGILRLPNIAPKADYMIGDLVEFLNKNIQEEIEEVTQMEQIVSKTKVDEFKKLLQFIQKQEEHHVLILQYIRRNL
ncbi:MAG: hypothetical protein R3331_11235 [Sulfurospirillaceae bacterium]|nr:hypothetical protein [Sulfurospirillaceae bacterium]